MKYSFIVACYNEEKYIEKCLNSIINQPYDNFEIIVVNDGSTDNSLKIINNTLKEFKNKQIIDQKNQGLSASRNNALKVSQGDFVMFVDGDDFISNDYLKVVEKNIKKNLDILKFNLKIINYEKEKRFKTNYAKNIITGEEAIKILIEKKHFFESPAIYIFSKKYLDKINFNFELGRYHEDFGSIPIAILKAKRIKLLNDTLYYYNQTPNSITRDVSDKVTEKRIRDVIWFYEENIKNILNIKVSVETKKLFISYMASAIISLWDNNSVSNKKLKKYILDNNVIDNLSNNTLKRKIKKIILKLKLKGR